MFERALSQDEIDTASAKGIKKARETFNRAARSDNFSETIRRRYIAALRCMAPLLDNFDPQYFIKRDNDKKSDAALKIIFLGAVQTLKYLEELEKGEKVTLFTDGSVVDWYRGRLSEAENVYRTNGEIHLFREPTLKAA